MVENVELGECPEGKAHLILVQSTIAVPLGNGLFMDHECVTDKTLVLMLDGRS